MSYIDSSLLPNEEVVYRTRLHWIIFLKTYVLIALGLTLLAAQPFGIHPLVGGVVILVGLLVAVPPFVRYRSSELGVTTKRVIVKVGLVRRRTLELLLRQVEAISVDQTVLGRVFGYGSITLTGTGGVREVFHNVSAPLELRRRIQGQTA